MRSGFCRRPRPRLDITALMRSVNQSSQKSVLMDPSVERMISEWNLQNHVTEFGWINQKQGCTLNPIMIWTSVWRLNHKDTGISIRSSACLRSFVYCKTLTFSASASHYTRQNDPRRCSERLKLSAKTHRNAPTTRQWNQKLWLIAHCNNNNNNKMHENIIFKEYHNVYFKP